MNSQSRVWFRVPTDQANQLLSRVSRYCNAEQVLVTVIGNICYFACLTGKVTHPDLGVLNAILKQMTQNVQKQMMIQDQIEELEKCKPRGFGSILKQKLYKQISEEIENHKNEVLLLELEQEMNLSEYKTVNHQLTTDTYYALLMEWKVETGDVRTFVSETGTPLGGSYPVDVDQISQKELLWLKAAIEQDEDLWDRVLEDAQKNHGTEGKIKAFLDLPTQGVKIQSGTLEMLSALSY